MTLSVVIGSARGLDPREVGSQAVRQAVDRLGRSKAVLGLVFASDRLPLGPVVSAAAALIGDTPLLGCSTSGELGPDGVQDHSVQIALLGGEEISIQAAYEAGYASDSGAAATELLRAVQFKPERGTLLLMVDAFRGQALELCAALPIGKYGVVGCLAGGELRQEQTFQVGGRQVGVGGLAGAYLSGQVVVSTAHANPWQPVGAYFRITQTDGTIIRGWNDKSPAAGYASLFGHTEQEWVAPPLSNLVRIYPLGIEHAPGEGLQVRSPLRIEPDGSLLLQAPAAEGSTAHVLIGSMEGCVKAAERAARQALEGLGKAKPVLALVWIDVAWMQQLQAHPGAEVQALRKVLGDIPMIGGYGYGQIARPQGGGAPELFTQHIRVTLFGAPS